VASSYANVHLIVNPASGKDEPILNVINDVFHERETPWTVHVTQKAGDATEMTRAACEDGADLVISYGGDGTVMEVINGLVGSDVPLGILPGGTGNAVAIELDVPAALHDALEMVLTSSARRSLDLGRVGDHYFILRLFTGIGEDQVASREMKDKYGLLAYPMTAFQFLLDKSDVAYHLILDGHEVTASGVICYVDNVGSIGGMRPIDILQPIRLDIEAETGRKSYKADVDPSDGLLDIILISRSVHQLEAFASYLLNLGDAKNHINYWQAKTVRIEADPPQPVWIDGEPFGETPVDIEVMPATVQVVVPEPEASD
jgi:YegS/Rv2252/BmrU family lipid kinase